MMKVLICIDDSECSSIAVDSVASQSWPAGTHFRVITVVEPILYEYGALGFGAYSSSLNEAQKEYGDHCLQLIALKVELLKKSTCSDDVTGQVLDGFIADSIIDEAKSWDADLIVLGSHGRKGLEKFLLGSVAEKVASHASCSVEIIKQKHLSTKKSAKEVVSSGQKKQG